MGGRLPLDYDLAKAKAEIERLAAIDSKSYNILANQQAFGRNVRGGFAKGQLNCSVAMPTGAGKTILGDYSMSDEKEVENNDIKQADIDYIGELIVDTRNYDIDEFDMGIAVMDSSVIALTGGSFAELSFKEALSSENIPELLGIDKLDECEVDIGVFRYVFGFNDTGSHILWSNDPDDHKPQLISKHKYPQSEEEFLDKEYAAE